MKINHILAVTAALATFNTVNAQVMPAQTPIDTMVGGSGASDQALTQLGAAAGEIKTLRKIDGPSDGRDRARTSINQFPVQPSELAGVEDYYLRSSYVTLGPKGFAPLHSHLERPAYLQVVSGAIHQHRSDGVSFTMGKEDFTFSSDSLAHWWHNDSSDEPITLWIVELCTAAHGCKAAVEGGASVLPVPSEKLGDATADIMKSIDLAGEFPSATDLGDRNFNLRRHDIAEGETFHLSTLGTNLTYIRVFKGELQSASTSQTISQGNVYLSVNGSAELWKNTAKATATLYSVEFEQD